MRVDTPLSRSMVLLAAVAGLSAQSLGAQNARLEERFPASKSAPALGRMMDSLPRPAAERLLSLIDSATKESLPTETIFLRALEGRVKRATNDNIIAAISRLHASQRHAREILGERASLTEVALAADVLQAGVSDERLTKLQGLRGKQTLTAPLNAWLNLVSRGAGADQAWDHITDLVKQKAGDNDFGRLTPADISSKLIKNRP